MRVMLDTNVLVSALLFPSERMNRMLDHISFFHELALSSFVIDELRAVVAEKFPSKVAAINHLLKSMSYELVLTPKEIPRGLFEIRDAADYPVVYSAMISNTDVLITGDKDFADVKVDGMLICTPADFLEQYCTECGFDAT